MGFQTSFTIADRSIGPTAIVTAPTQVIEGADGSFALSVTLKNVSAASGTVTMSLLGSSSAGSLDVSVPVTTQSYSVSQAPARDYTITLPSIAILDDLIVEPNKSIDIQIRATGQVFDSGSDTTIVHVALIDGDQAVGAGNTTLSGTAGTDLLVGGAGDDTLYGLAGHDQLDGGAGNDRLDGGTGADTMIGRAGDDTYIVDNAGDILIELPGEGNDRVLSSVTYALSTFGNSVEQLTLTGSAAINATGNALANVITGNAANNVLAGLEGDDLIATGGGRDTVDGGSGTDTLILSGTRASYALFAIGGKTFLLDTAGGALVANVEKVQFADGTFSWASLQATALPFDAAGYLARYADLKAAYGSNTGNAATHFAQYGFQEGRTGATFDALEYLASNKDLAAVFGANTAGATAHYLQYGIAEGRQTHAFDPLAYLAANPDLARAFGNDSVAAELHYILHGIGEARPTSFDALGYLASNRDLAVGIGSDTIGAELHYILNGLNEGRPTSGFDALEYIASNPDLALALGTNLDAAKLHYIDHGIAEGRATTSFDALRYLASNPDLARAYGTDARGAERHYIEHGVSEGRATTSFDPLRYLAANVDLARAYGNNPAGAEQHYIEHGLSEGRATSGFDTTAYLLSSPDLAHAGMTPEQALLHWVDHGAAEGRVGDTLYGREQTSHAASVGGTIAGALGVAGDHDWFQLDLAAGQHVKVTLASDALAPVLGIADGHGELVRTAGATHAVTIDFTADHAGLFYLTAAASDPMSAGNYMLSIEPVG